MHGIPYVLSVLGRNGPALLVASLLGGMLSEDVSSLAGAFVPLSAFLLTLGSFLSAALSCNERVWSRTLVPALLFVGVGAPLLIYGFIKVADLDDATELALLIAALAPPVGSAAAICAMLGLRPRLALAVSILLTLAAPVIMPTALALSGVALELDFGRVALRASIVIGCATLLTMVALRWRTQSARIIPDAGAAAGVSVIGLVIVGLAVAHGVAPMLTDRDRFYALAMLSIAANFGMCLLGALLFLRSGREVALTIGLLTGNRNVTLAWAVTGSSLPWDAQAYLVICVAPVLCLPLFIKGVLASLGWAKLAQHARLKQEG